MTFRNVVSETKAVVEDDKVHYSIRAVERVLRILSSFSAQQPKRSYLEIARETGIPSSTVFKLMQLLVSEGYLEPSLEQGSYEIGRELYRVGSLHLADRSLIDVASPALEELSRRLGLLATLAVRDNDRIFTLITKNSYSPISLIKPIGLIKPAGARGAQMYLSSVGKALMLDMTDLQVEALYPVLPSPGLTPKTFTDITQLKEDLAQSRERGYTIDDEASAIGLFCVGASIRDQSGEIIAGISVTGVKVAMMDHLDEISTQVRQTADKISRQLGFHTDTT